MAEDTDYIMPLWLPFAGIIFLILGLIVLMFIGAATGGFDQQPPRFESSDIYQTQGPSEGENVAMGLGALIFFIFVIVGTIIHIYAIYKWIDRRNWHFKRVRMLYRNLISYLEEKGSTKTGTMKSKVDEMELEEDDKNAVIWIVLYILIPILILYIWYFLGRDFRRHSTREQMLIRDLSENLSDLGYSANLTSEMEIPDRNFVIYLVLTIITLGLFGIYWVYVITKDPNEHFKQHRIVERKILDTLKS